MNPKTNSDYQKDLYNWLYHNADLLRQGNLPEIDAANIAGELEELKASQLYLLESHLTKLLVSAIKLQFCPAQNDVRWQYAFVEQRKQVQKILRRSPSLLNHHLKKIFVDAYDSARRCAVIETGVDISVFPQECPYSLKQILQEESLSVASPLEQIEEKPHRDITTVQQPLVFELADGLKRREQGGITFELHIPKLSLYKGQFIAIVGESGCGKSTLLDMLALVSKPTQCGTFVYFEAGKSINIKKLWEQQQEKNLATLRRSHLGYVLQTGGLLPFLTVWQNLQLPSKLNGYQNDSQIRALAKCFGVEAVLTKKPQYLSGGQRQRVAILRALTHRPKIILADEPTAAVDKKRAAHIVKDFYTLARESGTTIVMVTHDRELVAPVAEATYTFELATVSDTLTRSVCIPMETNDAYSVKR